ncbi:MAG: hypothetical protein ACLRTA_00470 [Clostridia bacterium]
MNRMTDHPHKTSGGVSFLLSIITLVYTDGIGHGRWRKSRS